MKKRKSPAKPSPSDHHHPSKRSAKETTTTTQQRRQQQNEEENEKRATKKQQQLDVSVLLPARDAKPYLSSCLLCLLAQRGCNLEIIAVDDSSADGSFEMMREFKSAYEKLGDGEGGEKEALGVGGGDSEPLEEDQWQSDWSLRQEIEELEESGNVDGYESLVRKYCVGGRHKMIIRKLERSKEIRSGQGLALNLAYSLSTCEYVAEMEADDVRPPRCFKMLAHELNECTQLDAVFSGIALIGDLVSKSAPQEGWVGMQRFEQWQNSLVGYDLMAKGRYIEIPAMRASGCYRRTFLEEKMNLNEGNDGGVRIYDDLWRIGEEVVDLAVPDDQKSNGEGDQKSNTASKRDPNHWWPVDVSFLHRAFNSGMKSLKLEHRLYWWRQYASQSTKIHERCSLERLRAAKVHYMLKEDGPLGFDALFPTEADANGIIKKPEKQKKLIIRVFGRGETLNGYVDDINREIEIIQAKEKKKRALENPAAAAAATETADASKEAYRPKLIYVVEKRDEMPGLPKRKRLKENLDENTKLARLFAFGMAKARAKVLRVMRDDFDAGGLDWFVA
jgi:glycosyltransferase involved in cell wall biosynthesis